MNSRFAFLAALAFGTSASPALSYEDVISGALRPGWQVSDGSIMAALELRLAPGWKTYWRAPGDSGIPPLFAWSGEGLAGIEVLWPRPQVFHTAGMRSIGYSEVVVLPLLIDVEGDGPVFLDGQIELGVCDEVCMPHSMSVSGILSLDNTRPDPVIAAALADMPLTGEDLGLAPMHCQLSLSPMGLMLRTEARLPNAGGTVEAAIETGDPSIWVSEPKTRWDGDRLISEAVLMAEEGVVAIDRSAVRLTVLRPGDAIELKGCAS